MSSKADPFDVYHEAVDKAQARTRAVVDAARGDESEVALPTVCSVGLSLPLSIYGAATSRLPWWARVGFGVAAVGTLARDRAAIMQYVDRLRGK